MNDAKRQPMVIVDGSRAVEWVYARPTPQGWHAQGYDSALFTLGEDIWPRTEAAAAYRAAVVRLDALLAEGRWATGEPYLRSRRDFYAVQAAHHEQLEETR